MPPIECYVGYHATCADGFGGAWAAAQAFARGAQPRYAEFLPLQYGDEPPMLPARLPLYLIDVSYKADGLRWLCERHEKVILIDHHATALPEAEAVTNENFTAYLDLRHSGACLAWQHFHGTPPPPLVRYVEDRDLWRWLLPHSREVSAALWSYPMEMESWSRFNDRLEDIHGGFRALVNEGQAILRYMGQQTAMICRQAHLLSFDGEQVPVVNASSLWSEVGEELLRQYPQAPFALSYVDLANGLRKWSLRSRPGFDCSAIATRFGGGGHPTAAGFETRAPAVL